MLQVLQLQALWSHHRLEAGADNISKIECVSFCAHQAAVRQAYLRQTGERRVALNARNNILQGQANLFRFETVLPIEELSNPSFFSLSISYSLSLSVSVCECVCTYAYLYLCV